MSQTRMNELFKAARQDGPSLEARAAMWTGIETASLSVAGSAVGGGSAFAAAKAAVLSSKLVLGLVLGASLTVGVAATLVTVNVVSMRNARIAQPTTVQAVDREEHVASRAKQNDEAIVGHARQATPDAPVIIELGKKDETVPAPAPTTRMGTTTLSEHDRLAREARMVSEARGALHRGEPDVALRIVRAARTQPGARLVPEELTVEAQALRATGDEAGAKRIEADLAERYPDHSLSR
jgi:hypothetical protein